MSETLTRLDNAATRLLSGIPVVDADTHVSEWYDLWTSRAPAKYKSRVPQVVNRDGKWDWVIDGKSMGRNGASSSVSKNNEKIHGMDFIQMQLADVHPGSYDVKARVRVMDEQGIAAQIA